MDQGLGDKYIELGLCLIDVVQLGLRKRLVER